MKHLNLELERLEERIAPWLISLPLLCGPKPSHRSGCTQTNRTNGTGANQTAGQGTNSPNGTGN